MGKKDKKKKDPEKKAAIAAKKEAKAEKAALKRLKKELGKEAATGTAQSKEEEDFDSILASYSQTNKNNQECTNPTVQPLTDPNHPFPSTRANFSFTYAPTTGEMYLFGGEYYNGLENVVYDDFYKFNPESRPIISNPETQANETLDCSKTTTQNHNDDEPQKRLGEWKQIISPLTPPARCAHSSVYYNNSIYIFGGELATTSQFHHYRDFWRFDISTNTWEEVRFRGSVSSTPSPRSGHRCVVWRHYMILFGGFYEALKGKNTSLLD